MTKEEVMRFALERVYCSFECGDGRRVEVYNDSQAAPYGGYDWRVVVVSPDGRERVYGSRASWGGDCRVRLTPNEESAVVALLPKEGKLALFVVRFKRTGAEFRDWGTLLNAGVPVGQNAEEAVALNAPDILGVEYLCGLEDVQNLYCRTTSGWEVEFFLERLPGEKAGEEGDRWVGILYRSNGAVTICRQRRDFPF
jgi:hypothetical protein